jgi:hypothetical protein
MVHGRKAPGPLPAVAMHVTIKPPCVTRAVQHVPRARRLARTGNLCRGPIGDIRLALTHGRTPPGGLRDAARTADAWPLTGRFTAPLTGRMTTAATNLARQGVSGPDSGLVSLLVSGVNEPGNVCEQAVSGARWR